MDKERLAANYRDVMDRAARAAERAGRPAGSWRLVAVTKTVDADTAAALVSLGAPDLAENRVQALVAKQSALAGLDVRWHFIGHLQTNKARKVAGKVVLVHGVDSLRLAEAIDAAAAKAGVVQDVLLEVNVSGEESKLGLAAEEAPRIAADARSLAGVRVVGLMTMAPIAGDAEETRPVFRALRELGARMSADGLFAREGFELSMGMTQDFEVAIEEGATLIRVGSALFAGV